jgi:hypothetical protein
MAPDELQDWMHSSPTQTTEHRAGRQRCCDNDAVSVDRDSDEKEAAHIIYYHPEAPREAGKRKLGKTQY